MKKKVLFIIVLMLICILIFTNAEDKILQYTHPVKFDEYVYENAVNYDVDALLIFAIIRVESNFDENSVSASGAKGLMQLMDATAEELASKLNMADDYDIFDAETNIILGTYYMSTLLSYYDDNLYLALAAYNAGIGNVNSWIEDGIIQEDGSDIENIPFKETNNYVRKVLRDYKIYRELYN